MTTYNEALKNLLNFVCLHALFLQVRSHIYYFDTSDQKRPQDYNYITYVTGSAKKGLIAFPNSQL